MAENVAKKVLTPGQARAVAALLAHPTMGEAATAAEISDRTLHRWLTKDPAFQAALQQAEGAAIDEATRRLIALQGKAVDTLDALLTDDLVSAALRLRAAQTVLDTMLKLRELRNQENRLAALEALAEEQGWHEGSSND